MLLRLQKGPMSVGETGLHCHEYGGITVLRNQRNYSSSDTASQPGTVQSSVKSAEVPTKPTFLILYRCMSGLLATAEPTHYSRHILNVWAPHTHPPTRHFLPPKDRSWKCKCTFGYLCKTEMLTSPWVSGSSCWPTLPSLPTRLGRGINKQKTTKTPNINTHPENGSGNFDLATWT